MALCQSEVSPPAPSYVNEDSDGVFYFFFFILLATNPRIFFTHVFLCRNYRLRKFGLKQNRTGSEYKEVRRAVWTVVVRFHGVIYYRG